jgi:hypothetical protein
MPETRCVDYIWYIPGYARNAMCALYLIYIRVYFGYKRTWLCQKRVVCIIFDIYLVIPETRCVHYVWYLRVYFDYKRTWLCQKRVVCIMFYIYVFILIISVPGLCQKRVVCIMFYIYVFILIISVPGYARNVLCALCFIFTCLFWL